MCCLAIVVPTVEFGSALPPPPLSKHQFDSRAKPAPRYPPPRRPHTRALPGDVCTRLIRCAEPALVGASARAARATSVGLAKGNGERIV